MRMSSRNAHRSPSPHLTIKTEDCFHHDNKLLNSCRGRDLHGPRLGAKMEPMTTKAAQRTTEITITDTQKTLVKKMEELVGQHHYRSNSGVASQANGSVVLGNKQAHSSHSKKVSLNLENAKKSTVFTPVQPGTSHSSTNSSAKKLSAMRSLDNSRVFDLNALMPSEVQSAKQSLTATPKRALVNIGAFSAATQKREDRKDEEGRRFYNRLFKRLEEESPHHPSTTYSPRHSGALSHRNSPRQTPGKTIESTIKKTGQLFKNKEDSDSTVKKPKIEETCNFGEIEISPQCDQGNNSSFTDTLNAEGNISIQSFLRESPEYRPQPHISTYQPPAMELKATPLNNDSDSSPEPIRLTKQYMRRSLKSSVGESIKHKWKSDRNVPKSTRKKAQASKNRQLFKTFQSNGGGYKSQEFSFTNDPNMSRNSVLHTLSSNDSATRPKEHLDLSFTSSKINYSSNCLEDVERADLHSSFTSRPGTARAKSSCYHSFKTPAQIVKPKHAASPSSTSTNQKENKNSAPKWKYSYKPDQKGKEFKTTTGFAKTTSSLNKSRCLTPKGSSRTTTNTTVSTRKSENSFMFSRTNNKQKRKSKTGFTTPQDQKGGSSSATKFFLEGGNEAETPTSCQSYRNFNQTLSNTTARTVFGSRRNSRNTSLNRKEEGGKFRKHNYKASPKPRKASTDDKKEIHFALFQTENNVKYGSIPVEERTMVNPEKAFKSFISSLKQEILQGAEEEAMIMKGQHKLRTIDNSNLRRHEEYLPSRPSSAQQVNYPQNSITHSLALMLNKEKYVKLVGGSKQEEGMMRNMASSTGKLLETPRQEKEDQNELDFELMECLSKRSDYEAFKDTAANSLLPASEEENKVSSKTLVSPLELPMAEKCNIKSVRDRSNSTKVQRVNGSEDKQHPSRSQNYSFGGGYEAADEQSTARRNIEDPQATPRLSTEEETEEERSSKTHKFLERHIYIEQGSPAKLARAKFEKANELRRSVTRRTPKGMKKSPAQTSSVQTSDKYFLNDEEHQEERLNTEEGKLTVVSPAPPVSFRQESEMSEIDHNLNQIEEIKTKMEDAVQRINQKVADAEIRNSRTSGFTCAELSFGNGKNRFNFNSSKESAADMEGQGDKKELSVIMEPSVKDTCSVPISPFDSPKTNSRAVSITEQSTLSQLGGIFSHKTSPRISRNVISKPGSERLFSMGKHISSAKTREGTEEEHIVDSKLIVEVSKYRRGFQKQRNRKELIQEFHKLKEEMKRPCPSFSLFYKIQTVATKIIQRNYKVFITRKRILKNVRRIALTRRNMGPFDFVEQEIKIYKSASTQTEKAKVQELIVTGEVVRRFAFNAFLALQAYRFLLQRNKI